MMKPVMFGEAYYSSNQKVAEKKLKELEEKKQTADDYGFYTYKETSEGTLATGPDGKKITIPMYLITTRETDDEKLLYSIKQKIQGLEQKQAGSCGGSCSSGSCSSGGCGSGGCSGGGCGKKADGLRNLQKALIDVINKILPNAIELPSDESPKNQAN